MRAAGHGCNTQPAPPLALPPDQVLDDEMRVADALLPPPQVGQLRFGRAGRVWEPCTRGMRAGWVWGACARGMRAGCGVHTCHRQWQHGCCQRPAQSIKLPVQHCCLSRRQPSQSGGWQPLYTAGRAQGQVAAGRTNALGVGQAGKAQKRFHLGHKAAGRKARGPGLAVELQEPSKASIAPSCACGAQHTGLRHRAAGT